MRDRDGWRVSDPIAPQGYAEAYEWDDSCDGCAGAGCERCGGTGITACYGAQKAGENGNEEGNEGARIRDRQVS